MKISVKSILFFILVVGVVGALGFGFRRLRATDHLLMHIRVVADIQRLRAQVDDYHKRNGVYPAMERWTQELGVDLFRDAWGNDYVYRRPGKRDPRTYDLFSAGPDRISDTADDDWGK